MTTARVVGSERPGLKPRAQSASPLKGAVRRPGARVDRLGAGAVWISRLQPAWGLSPAVHGRAIVDPGARLIGDACRARRVGRVESPRLWRGGRGSASPLHEWADASPVPHLPATVGRYPHFVGVRRCLTRPARQGRSSSRRRSSMCHSHRDAPVRAAESPRLSARSGEAAPRPYKVGEPIRVGHMGTTVGRYPAP